VTYDVDNLVSVVCGFGFNFLSMMQACLITVCVPEYFGCCCAEKWRWLGIPVKLRISVRDKETTLNPLTD
jgi:hypothetical protein